MHEDKFHDECAVVGVYGHPEAAKLAYLGLYALQHRGQESTGIVASKGQYVHAEVGMGRVNDFFTEERLARLPGHLAIGHNRYSTTGSSILRNAQPLLVDYARGSLAIAHNGNLVNAQRLRAELEAHGAIFRSTTDTEVILHLVAQSRADDVLDGLVEALQQVQGAYSLVIMNHTEIIAARDPCGFRPLCLGQLGDGYVIASETCALDLVEATYLRDVAPGELIRISAAGLQSYFPFPLAPSSQCIFELIYFARPDSNIFGHNVHLIRKAFGRQLAREAPVEADVVIPVPDSGIPAALGYAEEADIPFDTGLIRNHYVGRTFIEPQQAIRHFGVKIKLNAIRGLLEGKRVVVVDDSIVRGTTSQKLLLYGPIPCPGTLAGQSAPVISLRQATPLRQKTGTWPTPPQAPLPVPLGAISAQGYRNAVCHHQRRVRSDRHNQSAPTYPCGIPPWPVASHRSG